MALQTAIDRYHELLTNDALARDSVEMLREQLQRRGLFFGERPLASVLRPRFLTQAQYVFLQRQSGLLLSAFRKVHQRAMTDAAFRAHFGLFDWEESLLGMDPGFREPSPVSRLDAFFVPARGGLKFTEYNAETPAAASYNDVLAEVFLSLPVMCEFLKQYEVRPQPARHHVLHALMDAWRQFSSERRRPRIAIVDWKEVPTYSEFVISAEYFRAQGYECEILDPRALEYRDGRLRGGDFDIDLIYKRVLLSELVERGGLDHPVIRAVRDRAVCMVNPFQCKILHKKLSLAVLSDDRHGGMFSEAEREAIDMHVPWTRRVEPRTTTHAGQTVDLLPYIERQRQSFVLKPNDEYGGTGIVLGWEAGADEWAAALRSALSEPYVVQERIEIPVEVYPVIADGSVRFEERILDTAPFVFHGSYVDGCLTRLSTASLVNVTAGGGSSLATFVVEPRP